MTNINAKKGPVAAKARKFAPEPEYLGEVLPVAKAFTQCAAAARAAVIATGKARLSAATVAASMAAKHGPLYFLNMGSAAIVADKMAWTDALGRAMAGLPKSQADAMESNGKKCWSVTPQFAARNAYNQSLKEGSNIVFTPVERERTMALIAKLTPKAPAPRETRSDSVRFQEAASTAYRVAYKANMDGALLDTLSGILAKTCGMTTGAIALLVEKDS